jgi:hypothetical protein
VAAVVDHRAAARHPGVPSLDSRLCHLGDLGRAVRAVASIRVQGTLPTRPARPAFARRGLRAVEAAGLTAPLGGVGAVRPDRPAPGWRPGTTSSGAAVPVCPGAAGLPCNRPPRCMRRFRTVGTRTLPRHAPVPEVGEVAWSTGLGVSIGSTGAAPAMSTAAGRPAGLAARPGSNGTTCPRWSCRPAAGCCCASSCHAPGDRGQARAWSMRPSGWLTGRC